MSMGVEAALLADSKTRAAYDALEPVYQTAWLAHRARSDAGAAGGTCQHQAAQTAPFPLVVLQSVRPSMTHRLTA